MFEKYSKVDFDTKIRDWARYYYYDPSDAINANFIPEDVTVKDVIVTLLNKEDIYEKIHFDDDCLVEILLECIRELLTNSTNALAESIDTATGASSKFDAIIDECTGIIDQIRKQPAGE